MKYNIIIILFAITFAELNVGDPAPTFFVRDINEKHFFLSDTLKLGKITVLSFFTTWCVPCRVEIPDLDTLSQYYQDVNFYLVNVSGLAQISSKIKEDPEIVKKMITTLGVNLLVLMDKYGKVAEKYGVTLLPRLIVIDKKGKVHYIHDGYVPNDKISLKNVLSKLSNNKK